MVLKRLGCGLLVLMIVAMCWPAGVLGESRVLPLATGEWEPYTSAHMDANGFFTEIVSAVLAQMDVDPAYGFYPWKRCSAYVRSGDVFAAFPYSVTEARKAFAYFSEPVSYSETVLFYNRRKNSGGIQYAVMEDLRAHSIVGVLGYFYEERFKQANVTVRYVPTEEKAMDLIYRQRYDLYPINRIVGWNMIRKNYPDDPQVFSTVSTPLSTDSLHLMVSKKYPRAKQLMTNFNAALRTVRENGTYEKILNRHNISAR